MSQRKATGATTRENMAAIEIVVENGKGDLNPED
jgi:hypothetical protein